MHSSEKKNLGCRETATAVLSLISESAAAAWLTFHSPGAELSFNDVRCVITMATELNTPFDISA